MREKRGLPIAAHLALMLALAFTAAFAVSVAVIVLLPPRPPSVVRGDQLVERFAHGFADTARTGVAPADSDLRWRLDAKPPEPGMNPPSHMLEMQLAERVHLPIERIRINAEPARTDTFIYHLDMHEHHMRMNAVEIVHDGANVMVRRRVEGPAPPEPPQPPEPDVRGDRLPVPPLPPVPPEGPLFAPGVLVLSAFDIAAQLPDGRWLTMERGRNRAEIGWIGRAALATGATLTLLSLLALVFARGLARPIQGFAEAVQAVGVDPQSAAVAENGPREMRGAARAVNAMQARLRTLIADRTKTLATVAHDMRTPLMRLRLAAENAEPALRDKMAKEIGDVEALVASFISFARDDPAEEARVRIDLAALLQSLVDDRAAPERPASYEGPDRLIITGQSLGLKRLFSNLIDNALKYAGQARVTLSAQDGLALVDVADDGPGVPAAQREEVFKPFVRLGAAAGGAGLGLASARGIARAHGGDIEILPSDQGAHLRAKLPL